MMFTLITFFSVINFDIIFNMTATDGNDNAPLKERISSRHGLHTIDHAAAIGLGNLEYEIVDLDK